MAYGKLLLSCAHDAPIFVTDMDQDGPAFANDS
jgi:hypothetical protein